MNNGPLPGIFHREHSHNLSEADFVMPASETFMSETLSENGYKTLFLVYYGVLINAYYNIYLL